MSIGEEGEERGVLHFGRQGRKLGVMQGRIGCLALMDLVLRKLVPCVFLKIAQGGSTPLALRTSKVTKAEYE